MNSQSSSHPDDTSTTDIISFKPCHAHKACDIKVIDRSLTVREAIAKVFSHKEERQVVISNMNIVRDASSYYFDGEEQEREMYDISMPAVA